MGVAAPDVKSESDPLSGGGYMNCAETHGDEARETSASDARGFEREWKRIVTASSSCIVVYYRGIGGFL